MQFKLKLNKSGFSIIEISIVIVVIGIFTSGVIQGIYLFKAARISKARQYTMESPVSLTKNLILWLETTMQQSFPAGKLENGTKISQWNNLSQVGGGVSATQSTSLNSPTYSVNPNGLPTINFSGNQFFYLNNFRAGNNATYFFVLKPPSTSKVIGVFDSAQGQNYSLRNDCNYVCSGGTPPTCSKSCANSGTFSWWSGSRNISEINMTLKAGAFLLLNFDTSINSSGRNINFYLNKVLISSSSDPDLSNTAWGSSPTIGLVGTTTFVNNTLSTTYTGDIGEIIVFNRVLKDKEREDISNYLIQKWNIKN